ncbi:MAG: hypothetical protein M5U28_26605 [Sandaracinaceae bacterium]|nr:hypothetical protein [Sandaracinaceae bacterium]
MIASRILAEIAEEEGPVRALSEPAMAALTRRAWPGNVRELRNVLKRAVLLSSAPVLSASDLGPETAGLLREAASPPPCADAAEAPMEVSEDLPIKEARDRWVAPMEREYLVRLVRRSGGDLDKAAEAAGIHRKSLERLLRQHGLKATDFRD